MPREKPKHASATTAGISTTPNKEPRRFAGSGAASSSANDGRHSGVFSMASEVSTDAASRELCPRDLEIGGCTLLLHTHIRATRIIASITIKT